MDSQECEDTMTSPEQGKLNAYAEQIAVAVLTHNVIDKPFNQDWGVIRANVAATLAAAQAAVSASNAAVAAVKALPQPAAAAPVFPLQLVQVKDDPAVYATGPGVFRHVVDGATLDAGTAAGLWGTRSAIRLITAARRDQLLAFADKANGLYVPPAPATPAAPVVAS
jgi:hypothetical protein